MIEAAIVALLNADAAVAALIAGRIYPIVLPEDGDPDLAAVTYQVISDIPEYTLDDGVTSQLARVQITSWGRFSQDAKQLANAIRDALEEYTGPSGCLEIANAWIAGQSSSFEPDLRRQRVQTDYKLIYSVAGGD